MTELAQTRYPETSSVKPGRGDDQFLAADPAMLQIRRLARRAAATTAPVLIQGESGVGKEVLARFIHTESPRASRPFVKINCAALPHDLLLSELFGYERGASNGAGQRKVGRLEQANGGTLLLDDIGEMSAALQAKLLQVLEDLSFVRIGGTQPIRLDARIIAATDKALDDAIRRGEFRKDLYFRLKVIRIDLPPLRERPADIPLLCEHFLRQYPDGQGATTARLPDRLLEALLRYPWPGNVRELRHVIQRYTIFPDVDMVLSELLADENAERGNGNGNGHGKIDDEPANRRLPGSGDGEREAFTDFASFRGNGLIPLKSIAIKAAEEAEKRVILQVLEQTRWNRRRAAARLDICYKTLLNKLNHWQLDTDKRSA